MNTCTSQEKLTVGSASKLQLNYCQENLFAKNCYMYVSLQFKKKTQAFIFVFRRIFDTVFKN